MVSLELAKRIAEGLPHHKDWLDFARLNLDRWSRINGNSAGLLRCYSQWREILQRPVPEICAVLIAQTDDSQRLRQNSPFAGVLSPREVWEIKRQLRRHDTATADCAPNAKTA